MNQRSDVFRDGLSGQVIGSDPTPAAVLAA
jgi:hypothetical protein